MKILSIANTSGGSGKSTTALAIAVAAAEYGRNVLLIDFDERANLTFQLAIENPRFTMLEVASGSATIELSVIRTSERIDFIASAPRITALDSKQVDLIKFKEKLNKYDLVVIDTSSGLSQRLLLAGQLSDAVLFVTTDSLNSIRGVLLANDFFKDCLKFGVLPIMSANQNSVISALSNDFKVINPVIPTDQAILTAQIANKSVLNFDKTAAASDAYREITYFLLEELFGSKTDTAL